MQEGWPRITSGLKDKETRSQREQLQKAVKTKSIGDYGYLHNERGKKNRVGALEVNSIGSENVITIFTVMLLRSLKCYDKKIDVPFNSFFFSI